MKDIPYSALKRDERAYEIMLLRDQHGNTFSDIARAFALSTPRVSSIYFRTKTKQIRLYINHISITLGHSGTAQVRKVFDKALECYQDYTCAGAYLEKKYKDILTAYRDGEPGMPAQFMKRLPPFRRKLHKQDVARIIEMREAEKIPFAEIAKELRITPAKARYTYDNYYHVKSLALFEKLGAKAKSTEEKWAIWDYYFRNNYSAKKRYGMLLKDTSPSEE